MAAVAPCLRPVRRISKNDSSITQRNRDFIICKSFATAATPAAIQIPEYQKMLAAIRTDQVSNVVVLNLSRLNRSYENQHQLLLELEKHNVVLHSVLEQLSGSIVPVFSTFLKAGCA